MPFPSRLLDNFFPLKMYDAKLRQSQTRTGAVFVLSKKKYFIKITEILNMNINIKLYDLFYEEIFASTGDVQEKIYINNLLEGFILLNYILSKIM